jgi:hypothetical protein
MGVQKLTSKTIYVNEDGEKREATPEEIEQFKIDAADAKAKQLAKEAAEIAKENAKAELLARLGITAEEAKLLLS